MCIYVHVPIPLTACTLYSANTMHKAHAQDQSCPILLSKQKEKNTHLLQLFLFSLTLSSSLCRCGCSTRVSGTWSLVTSMVVSTLTQLAGRSCSWMSSTRVYWRFVHFFKPCIAFVLAWTCILYTVVVPIQILPVCACTHLQCTYSFACTVYSRKFSWSPSFAVFTVSCESMKLNLQKETMCACSDAAMQDSSIREEENCKNFEECCTQKIGLHENFPMYSVCVFI